MSGTGIQKGKFEEQSIRGPHFIGADGQEVVLTDGFSIGRSPDCSLKIEDTRASRRHALLELTGRKVLLRDLDSHNGTWVNGEQITAPTELHDGDQVRIGRTTFTFKATAAPSIELELQPDAEPKTGSQTRGWDLTIPMTLVRSSDGAEIGLNREITIGRAEANDLVLKGDGSASHSHATIKSADGQVIIQDLNSNNGTWVNGKRISNPTTLKHGDKIRMGEAVFRLRVGDRPLPAMDGSASPAGRARWVPLAISLLAVVLVAAGLIYGVFTSKPTGPSTTGSAAPAVATEDPIPQALRATVYIRVISDNFIGLIPDSNGKLVLVNYASGGSGSLIGRQGYVLTNFHVLGNAFDNQEDWKKGTGKGDLYDEQELILVGLNPADPEAQPNTFYHCEIAAKDPDLDLAVLHILGAATSVGDPYKTYFKKQWTLASAAAGSNFSSIRINQADDLKAHDPISVIGFPGIGGYTATVTSGIISGFIPDEALSLEKGWIKTDANIAEGNSGGMAINERGELIGVPTWGKTSQSGGKINYIRPILHALDLIRSACPACLP